MTAPSPQEPVSATGPGSKSDEAKALLQLTGMFGAYPAATGLSHLMALILRDAAKGINVPTGRVDEVPRQWRDAARADAERFPHPAAPGGEVLTWPAPPSQGGAKPLPPPSVSDAPTVKCANCHRSFDDDEMLVCQGCSRRFCEECVASDWSEVGEERGCSSCVAASTEATPSEDDVEAIEEEVGMGSGAWDMVDPIKIVAAAWKRLESRRTTAGLPPSDDIDRLDTLEEYCSGVHWVGEERLVRLDWFIGDGGQELSADMTEGKTWREAIDQFNAKVAEGARRAEPGTP